MTHIQHRRITHGSLAAIIAALMLVPSMAPATVEEQRARLPSPATCQDPVEGVWMSHRYHQRFKDWYIFTLEIHRISPGSPVLTGQIQSHAWDGEAGDVMPPPCRGGFDHWTVRMTAQGSASTHGQIEFWGLNWAVENTFCGHAPRAGEYYLDHFSGTIDATLQEFQSVNNDGGRSLNDPTVFRRVRCFENASIPHVAVKPPPFQPPGRAAGCARW
jgi:hypothetical protein